MSLRTQLKSNKTVRGRRWTIKRDKNDNLTGVKMIFETFKTDSIINSNPNYAMYSVYAKMYGVKEKIYGYDMRAS